MFGAAIDMRRWCSLMAISLWAVAGSTAHAQYLGEAARAGSRRAALWLSRKFGRGSGVAQSYATAGAWLTGKGATDEPIDSWDYSIGYASTVLGEVLSVNYPALEADGVIEFSFVVEINALRPAQLVYRMTSAASPVSSTLSASVEKMLRARLAESERWLAPPDARWLVSAGVAVPVTLHYVSRSALSKRESDLILR
jgi:hypothetical protein